MAEKLSVPKVLAAAKKAAKAENWEDACRHFQRVLQKFPSNGPARRGVQSIKPKAVQALLIAAQDDQKRNARSQAENKLECAFFLAPELPEIGVALAQVQLQTRSAPMALRTIEETLTLSPGNVEAINIKGKALRDMGKGEEAIALYLSVLGRPDTDKNTLTNLASVSRALGDKQAERDYTMQAYELAPNDPSTILNMSRVTKFAPNDPRIEDIRLRLATADPNEPTTAGLHNALFKAYHETQDFDAAIDHLTKGNALIRKAIGYDFKQDAMRYALVKNLTQNPLPAKGNANAPRPIFVLGLPRSGTTLVERILSRAPGVQACGELSVVQNAIWPMVTKIMDRPDKSVNPDDIAEIRESLLGGLAEYSNGSPIQIDKMPLNFRLIWFICAALPEARIVHMNRDPMAVGWSLYRHTFKGTGNGFVYDLGDIAKFMLLHRETMTHWRDTCEGYIFDLHYEALVNNPKSATQDLAKFLELEWTEDWMAPEKAKGVVLTASAEQARKPIYAGSNEDWKAYKKHLEPLEKALTSAGLL